jgi:hypothetical protein
MRSAMTIVTLCCAIALQLIGQTADEGTAPTQHWYASPEWWLVGVGVFTLLAIYYQSRKTAEAAIAAADSVTEIKRQADIMERQAQDADIDIRRLNRAYLTVDTWMPSDAPPGAIGAKFRIYNPSRTAARIESIQIESEEVSITLSYGSPGGRMLTPREGYWFDFNIGDILGVDMATVFTIRGRITYTDIFRRTRYRRFAKMCILGGMTPQFADAEGAGWNDEENWDQND